jgi:hypothetical protein
MVYENFDRAFKKVRFRFSRRFMGPLYEGAADCSQAQWDLGLTMYRQRLAASSCRPPTRRQIQRATSARLGSIVACGNCRAIRVHAELLTVLLCAVSPLRGGCDEVPKRSKNRRSDSRAPATRIIHLYGPFGFCVTAKPFSMSKVPRSYAGSPNELCSKAGSRGRTALMRASS